MAVTYESETGGSPGFPVGGVQTRAHNVGTNADRLVVTQEACFTPSGGTTINSCTFNGNSMTAQTAGTSDHPAAFRFFHIAGDSSIPSGSSNVVATMSDDSSVVAMSSVAYSGVDTASPLRDVVSAEGTGTSASFTVTSETGDICVAVFFKDDNLSGAVTPGSGVTSRRNSLLTTPNHYLCIFEKAGASGSTTIDATWASSNIWFGYAVSIKPAGGVAAGGSSRALLLGVG